jgi:alpha-glucosidase (family GH31 glycosyl hydrolase)
MSFKFKVKLLFSILSIITINSNAVPFVWEKGPLKIYLHDNRLELFQNDEKITEILNISFNFISADTILVEQVKTDTLILKLMFSTGDGFHDDFPTAVLLNITAAKNSIHFSAAHPAFNHITIQLKDHNEHYFGLIEKLYPHNNKNPDLRGQTVDLDVYGLGNLDYAENYASAYSAFFMSSAGYGSFFDTFAKGRYQFAVNGITEIYHQTSTLDWYLFYGQNGTEIHRAYFKVIGRPKPVPIWACGAIFWRDQNNGGKDELLDDIRRFSDLKIPLTACWIDRPYSHGANEWSKMDFNEKFSAAEQWIKQINNDYNLQFMTWVGPMTFTDKDFPGLLTDSRGYIDLTNPDALQEFEYRLQTRQYSVGVKGHKMDRADENFPLTVPWYQPVVESAARNKYIYLYSKVINDFLYHAHGKDQFNFARAAYHRCQPYLSAVWGGDSRSNWLGMAGSQANAIRCGFMGFPVWGQDTGGYLGAGHIDESLYIRWLQWGAWNGMFEIKIDGSGGSGEDRPPWKYSKQLQDVFRNVCDLRMQLLPYIYSCANSSCKNGVLMKPLAYVFPQDSNTYNLWDEYIFGDCFLVAPVFNAENKKNIYLPAGKWYDFNDLKSEYSGPLLCTRQLSLQSIPVFIKENSIYVSGNIYQGNSKLWQKNIKDIQVQSIIIHIFPGRINDSTAFNYVDYLDHDAEKTMTLIRRSGYISFSADPLLTEAVVNIKCDMKPQQILLNNKPVPFVFDRQGKIARIKAAKNNPINLEIR